MAGTTGLEPATSAVTGQRSNQLSYVPFCKFLTPKSIGRAGAPAFKLRRAIQPESQLSQCRRIHHNPADSCLCNIHECIR